MAFTLRTCLSTTPSVIFRNKRTCECLACSFSPPAIERASAGWVPQFILSRTPHLPSCYDGRGDACAAATKLLHTAYNFSCTNSRNIYSEYSKSWESPAAWNLFCTPCTMELRSN
jgi:hypothetical protein